MTLQDLRTYYRLREYQISHLLNAQEFFKMKNGAFDMQLWLYLFYWADAMYEADKIMFKLATSNLVEQSRGKA